MKKIRLLIVPILLVACSGENTETAKVFTTDDSTPIQTKAFDSSKLKELITVYGNVHIAVGVKHSEQLLDRIERFQDSIYENLTEEIIVLEGLAFSFNPVTKDTFINKLMNKNGLTAANYMVRYKKTKDYMLKDAKYMIHFRYAFEGNKLMFGSEDWDLFKKVSTSRNPISKDNLDMRSKKILENTLLISKMYPGKKIAIIIGRRHLDWFKEQGFKTMDFE